MYRLLASALVFCTISGMATAQSLTEKGAQKNTLNPEDCNVMAALARDLLHLDKVRPDASTFAKFYRPEGDSYVEQCPWRELGIEPLPLGKPDLYHMRFFTSPLYGADGKTASINFVTRLVAVNKYGKPLSPFVQVQTCRMTKASQDWHLEGYTTSAIT